MFCISRCSPLQTLGFAAAEPVPMLPDGTAIPEWWHLPAGSRALQDSGINSAVGTLGKIPAGPEVLDVGLWARLGVRRSPPCTHPTQEIRTRIAPALSVIGILGGWWWWCPCHQCLN